MLYYNAALCVNGNLTFLFRLTGPIKACVRLRVLGICQENKKPFRITRNGVFQPRLVLLPRP